MKKDKIKKYNILCCATILLSSFAETPITLATAEDNHLTDELSSLKDDKLPSLNEDLLTIDNPVMSDSDLPSIEDSNKNITNKKYVSKFRKVTSTPLTKYTVSAKDIENVKKSDKKWGTSNYTFTNGILIIGAGEIDNSFPVDKSKVKEIHIIEKVTLPMNSTDIFSSLPIMTFMDGGKLDFSEVFYPMAMFANDPELREIEGMGNWTMPKVKGDSPNSYFKSNHSSYLYGNNGYQEMFLNDKKLEVFDTTKWTGVQSVKSDSNDGITGYYNMLKGADSIKKIIIGKNFNLETPDSYNAYYAYFEIPAAGKKEIWREDVINSNPDRPKYNYVQPWIKNVPIRIDEEGQYLLQKGKTYIKDTTDEDYKYGTLHTIEQDNYGDSMWIYNPTTKIIDLYSGDPEKRTNSYYNKGQVSSDIRDNKDAVKIVSHGKIKLPETSYGLFKGMTSLKEIVGMGDWDVSGIKGDREGIAHKDGENTYGTNAFQSMFENCPSLEILDTTNWNTLSHDYYNSNEGNYLYGYSHMITGDTSLKKIIMGKNFDMPKYYRESSDGGQRFMTFPKIKGKEVWQNIIENNDPDKAEHDYIYPWVRGKDILIENSVYSAQPGQTYEKVVRDQEYKYGTLHPQGAPGAVGYAFWIYNPKDKIIDLYSNEEKKSGPTDGDSDIRDNKDTEYIISHGKVKLPLPSIGMFKGMTKLKRIIGMGDWDTTDVNASMSASYKDPVDGTIYNTNGFQEMFANCTSLEVLDTTNWTGLPSEAEYHPVDGKDGYDSMLKNNTSLKKIIMGKKFDPKNIYYTDWAYARLTLPNDFVNVGNGTLNNPEAKYTVQKNYFIDKSSQDLYPGDTYVRKPSSFNEKEVKVRFVNSENNTVMGYGKKYSEEINSLIFWEVRPADLPAGAKLADGQKAYGRYKITNADNQVVDVKVKVDKIDYSVNVKDNTNSPVKNIEFIVTDKDGKTVDTVTTDNNGNIHVVLPPKEYIVKPSNNIDGFEKPKDIILTPQNPTGEIVMERYDFSNQLPETGKTTTILLIAMLSMLSFANIAYLANKNRKDLNI